jgi:hypothetical protein
VSVILLVRCGGYLLGVGNKSIRWQVICMPTHLEAGLRITQRTIFRRIPMTPLIALAAIVATIKLSVCLGSDEASSSAGGCVTRVRTPCLADQLSSNPLWHSATIPRTAHGNACREAAGRGGNVEARRLDASVCRASGQGLKAPFFPIWVE